MGLYISYFTGFKKSYNSVWREVLYNILTEFCIPVKQVSQIKMCFKETESKSRTCKHLSHAFPIENFMK
jgi:hypothetical protein